MCSGQAGPGSSQDVAQAQQGLEPFIVAIEQSGDLPMTNLPGGVNNKYIAVPVNVHLNIECWKEKQCEGSMVAAVTLQLRALSTYFVVNDS